MGGTDVGRRGPGAPAGAVVGPSRGPCVADGASRAMKKDILAPAQAPLLKQLAWSNLMLAFDYDGTLAPIVDDPEKARMRTTTRALLEKVARAYPSIVISGRAQEDVLKRVRGAGVF